MTWHELFGAITGKRNPKRTLTNAKWQVLNEDTNFEGISYAKGSRFKVWEGSDFGYVGFAPESKTPEGNTPGKFLHKF